MIVPWINPYKIGFIHPFAGIYGEIFLGKSSSLWSDSLACMWFCIRESEQQGVHSEIQEEKNSLDVFAVHWLIILYWNTHSIYYLCSTIGVRRVDQVTALLQLELRAFLPLVFIALMKALNS